MITNRNIFDSNNNRNSTSEHEHKDAGDDDHMIEKGKCQCD